MEKGRKVLLAIGGWTDSIGLTADRKGNKYSILVNNATLRAKFIEHVVGFLKTYKFDGLDLDWEYPACPQVIFK